MSDKGMSLLAKWIWRFGKEKSSLRKKVLCAKYGLGRNPLMWDSKNRKQGSPFFLAVCRFFDNSHRAYNIVTKGFKVVVGNGNRIRLWNDICMESFSLQVAFPRIYTLASNKEGVLNEFGRWEDSKWLWVVNLRRPLFDWEVNQWNNFLAALGSICVRNDAEDSLAWSFSSNGLFSVRSFRLCLEELRSSGCQNNTLLSSIWQGICPPKVEVFSWQLLRGRILVREVMFKFGMAHLANLVCPMCGAATESIDHLFLTCDWANVLWRRCMDWWGVHCCLNSSMVEWFSGWVGLCPSKSRRRAWNVLFYAVIWSIWESRNNVVFRDSNPCLSLAMDSIQFRVALWFKNLGQGSDCDLTLLMLDLKDRCIDNEIFKVKKKVAWIPPTGNVLCFNVDGSSRGNPGDAGIGGVLRDSSGKVLCLFSYYVGVEDSITAEVMAIHRACLLISSNSRLAGRNIDIFSDSKTAVSWINGQDFGCLKLVNWVYDIRSFLLCLDGVSVSFMPRDSNSFADSLAKSGSDGNKVQYNRICKPLYLAALKGDWEEARVLIEGNPSMVRAAITEGYETALHVATKAQQTDFVLKIMEHMNEQDLTLQNLRGDTAFCFAVATGNIQLVEVMRNRNPDLATLRGSWNMTPLYLAVLLGKEKMAWFLYDHTVEYLTAEERARIFFQSIKTDLYDMAFRLLTEANELAVTRDMDDDTALHVLARKPPSIFAEGSLALMFVKYLWQVVTNKQNVDIEELIRHPSNLLFDAARMGNFPLLAEFIRLYPDMVFELDKNKRTIFHIAILHRHSNIFNLIHELGYVRELIATYVDAEKNTLLHMVAKHPNQSLLSTTALEMQQELLLFKEVEKVMHVSLREAKNIDGLTPGELFTIEHSKLLKSGSEWMRNTAGSCMLVATLIATMVFAAAFTVPGGNNDDTGMPLLQKNIWFRVFAVSDAIALSFSSLSILIILSILTSRYTETDFYRSLTLKMMIALLALFISVIAMSITFSSTFFLVYQNRSNTIPIITLIVVTLPITVFVLLQYTLLKDMFYLTYHSSSLRYAK